MPITMQKEVKKSWALFLGIGTMMIAHGLQMQVMGIRSVTENFNVVTTGIFMSGYFMGYFVGSHTTPKHQQFHKLLIVLLLVQQYHNSKKL